MSTCAHMLTHTPAIQGHIAPSAYFSLRCSTHWGLSLPPGRAPESPPYLCIHTASQTHPGSLSQTLAPRVHHRDHTSWPSHVDTHCHSFTHTVHAHTYYSHSHSTDPHMCSLKTGSLTYGCHHTFRTVYLPHRYHRTSRNSVPQSPSASPAPTFSSEKYKDTHSE